MTTTTMSTFRQLFDGSQSNWKFYNSIYMAENHVECHAIAHICTHNENGTTAKTRARSLIHTHTQRLLIAAAIFDHVKIY